MRKLALMAAAALAALSTPALATRPVANVNPPTLHGFCSLGNICTDNGTNTPTTVNPPVFAFAASGQGATGNLLIDILIPNNFALNTLPTTFSISGALSGTASLFSSTAWTGPAQLDAYLGLPQGSPPPVNPANPIGAYLPATQGFQPGATGFFVFQANLGLATLLGTSGVGGPTQDSFLMQLGQAVPAGTYIVGFLGQGTLPNYGATANSGAILITSPPPPVVPEPATWAMMLVGFGATGFALRRTRRKALLTQIA